MIVHEENKIKFTNLISDETGKPIEIDTQNDTDLEKLDKYYEAGLKSAENILNMLGVEN